MGVTAIFGGTFNPFHIGHYEILKSLCEKDYIDEIFLMPDKIPPHKSSEYLASDEDRINMCRIISEKFCKVKLCLIEFEREGKSYTYDTVLKLKELYPDKNFSVVIGGDMAQTLHKWYRFEDLIKEVSFIAFNRSSNNEFNDIIKNLSDKGVRICVIDDKITDVSSTKLRADLNKNLIPKEVYEYITERGIYNE